MTGRTSVEIDGCALANNIIIIVVIVIIKNVIIVTFVLFNL